MAAAAMSPPSEVDVQEEIKPTLTPPASDEADKHDDDGSGSELSDLDMEPEDNGDIVPDHYYEGGKVPVFKPTMDQFRSFKSFISKIDKYGMKSGIVKVIPPKEWRDSLPPLDEQVKTVKVKNPITQEFHGTHGTYTQANIEKQRSYNLPQWKALSEESNHQPPAKRGERRRNQPQTTRSASTRNRSQTIIQPNGKKRGPGRPRVRPLPTVVHKHDEQEQEQEEGRIDIKVEVPPTPTSPAIKPSKLKKEQLSDDEDLGMPKTKGRQPKSVSSRRQHNRRDQTDVVDEEAFKGFDYRVHNQDEWTPERCNELETAYWKSLTFNNPMYGADMPGSLFDDSTESWNVAKLENLLDVLGQKVPGVNTAYLYLGMWKASFAWHLEDVDLYSINYIHFGAPKQWYSISQEDARRFEAAMRSVWPTDAKNCDQFLRHKTYLISPQLLQSQYNIRVNRLVHHEGEFVITFPYGYHSGYNLGYNCAESVNFATEAWLDYGKVARKCNCEADSVWVDVHDIERKMRGEPTPEYYEETEEEDEDDEEDDDGPTDLPTPPGSDKGKPKRRHKRKRDVDDKGSRPKVKRLRIKLKAPLYEPCILCPSDNPHEKLLPTDNGHEAHRRCALYTPETYISGEGGSERICDVARIDKARLELKCNYCRNKRGAVFQCSQRKCTRAYHATCAAAAGVQVDIGLVPVYGEDGTEYTDTGIDFRCRFHRIKRGKNVDGQALEDNSFIRKQASKLPVGELVQMQYHQGDIFAGTVLENRKSEQMLVVEVLPKGDKIEIEYKWLLIFDPVNSQLPIPSENAKPLPPELAQKSRTTAEHPSNDNPKADEPFGDPQSKLIWSEFNTCKTIRNPLQVKVDVFKPRKFWFYLGKTSTEAKAQYTGDLAVRRNDPTANFLESVRIATAAAALPPRRSFPASYPAGVKMYAVNASRPTRAYIQPANLQPNKSQINRAPVMQDRTYHGKYAITDPVPHNYKARVGGHVDSQALHNQRTFQQNASRQSSQQPYNTQNYQNSETYSSYGYRAPPAPMGSVAPTAPMKATASQRPSSLHADIYGHSTAQSYHPQQQERHSRPQAPVANMMGDGTTVPKNPFSRPPSAHKPTPAYGNIVERLKKASGESTVPLPEKYVYLHEADKLRPAVYQSPYAAEGGFTPAYQPNPTAPSQGRPKSESLSQDFLKQCPTSQQEGIKSQLFRDREEMIKRQEETRQEEEDQKCEAEKRKYQQQSIYQPPTMNSMPSRTTVQPLNLSNQHHPPPPQPSYYRQPTYQYDSYSAYQNPPQHQYSNSNSMNPAHSLQSPTYASHHSPQTPTPNYNYSHSRPPGGLQFQSPQDFQMQMQREAQQQEWTKSQGSFDHFFRGLQNAAANNGGGNGVSTGYGSGGGGQATSPLKAENGGGAEMLPVMGGRY